MSEICLVGCFTQLRLLDASILFPQFRCTFGLVATQAGSDVQESQGFTLTLDSCCLLTKIVCFSLFL